MEIVDETFSLNASEMKKLLFSPLNQFFRKLHSDSDKYITYNKWELSDTRNLLSREITFYNKDYDHNFQRVQTVWLCENGSVSCNK